jgi:hypothetical protein
MKFRKNKVKKRVRGSRGPAPSVTKDGATCFPFILPNPFRERVAEFNNKAEEHKIKKLKFATIFREGGNMYMNEQEKKLKLAMQGKLHAKRR